MSKKDQVVVNNEEVVEQDAVTEQDITTENNGEETTEAAQPSLLGKFFAAKTEQQFVSGRGNQKAATADLTNVSMSIMNDIIADLSKPESLAYEDIVARSQQGDNDATDALIESISPLGGIDIEFLTRVDAEELDKMLRSQQSKRSRAKNKDGFTLDDFKTMLTAAIAEGLLRRALNKPKGSGGASYDTSGFTDAEIAEFKADEEKLAKAIRNVQSKKSIAKNKKDFDETGEHWQHLLSQEAFLKNLRDSAKATIPAEVERELDAKKAAEELLASVVDVENMNDTDVKDLLLKLKETLVGAAAEPTTEAGE
ncbi:hypothetical protein D3C75_333210 [compost metagenome]